MAQTQRTVNELIYKAFLLTGELGDNQTLPGEDLERGFELLNLIIDHYSGDSLYIPITQSIEFNLVADKQDYTFSNVPGINADIVSNRIVSKGIQNCNIDYQSILYPILAITRNQIYDGYFNQIARTRPAYVLQINDVDKTTLRFFNIPDQLYLCKLQAKFYLNKFEKFQPIRNVPLSIQRFLIYELAYELIQYYPSGNWTPNAQNILDRLRQDLLNTNDIDLSVNPSGLIRDRYWYYNGLYSNIVGG